MNFIKKESEEKFTTKVFEVMNIEQINIIKNNRIEKNLIMKDFFSSPVFLELFPFIIVFGSMTFLAQMFINIVEVSK